jgi:hypothetical protein
VLECGDAPAAGAIAAAAIAALGLTEPPLSLSCGAAALRPGAKPADLFRAADMAQYRAKRGRDGRVVVAGDEPPPIVGVRRAHRDRTSAETRALADELVAAIDGVPDGDRAERVTQVLLRLT